MTFRSGYLLLISTKILSDVILILYNLGQFIISRNCCSNMVRRGPKHYFVQIPFLNQIHFPTSQLVKVEWKSHRKKGLSHAKKVVGHMTFDVRWSAIVKQVWFISNCFFSYNTCSNSRQEVFNVWNSFMSSQFRLLDIFSFWITVINGYFIYKIGIKVKYLYKL